MAKLSTTLSHLLDTAGADLAQVTSNTLGQQAVIDFIGAELATGIAALAPVAPAPAPASAPYPVIYAFGDSLTDDGNIARLTAGLLPAAPYVDGHFTNGNVWIQDLAQDLGIPVPSPSLAGGTDFAYGGAETGTTAVHQLNPTDFPAQIAQFAAQVRQPAAGALYAVWIGSNDVLGIADSSALTQTQKDAAIGAAVQNEVAGIAALAAHGAQDFLVLDVPDLGITPYEQARGATAAAAASADAKLYDQELAQAMQQLNATGALKIDLIDTYSILDSVAQNPAAYGFANVTQPVWTGSFDNPQGGTLAATGAAQNQYLFFDQLHPTAQTHALLAAGIAQQLTSTA